MNMKIVADSSANLLSFEGVPYASVPLKIVTDEKEYVDDLSLDTDVMLEELAAYKGRSGTSCPNVGEWLDAFGEAEYVFAVAITSQLSGCCNAAVQAKQAYEQEHPGRQVCVLDSLSTGPEMVLIVEKLGELIREGLSFGEIEAKIRAYMKSTHLLVLLESLDNLAKNGRVSPLIAKAVGFLNIRIVGQASDDGFLQQLHKARGEKKGMDLLVKEMKNKRFTGGKVRIAHSGNPQAAGTLKGILEAEYPGLDVTISPCGGLCCFYAEKGGLLVGFEG
ncbi:MAG: DegV family protein [Eubacteriales bacterium]|nr:DegV family protein [Eubacteriales bacterium]